MPIDSRENDNGRYYANERERNARDRRAIDSRSPRSANTRRKSPPTIKRTEEERGRSRQQKSFDTKKRPLENNASDGPQNGDQRNDGTENDEMAALMGFSSFGSTKQKKVNPDVGSASVSRPSKFRQYMNREKGFNRDLSPP